MASELDQDVEDFRRRLDSFVSADDSYQRPGVGIIEEIVEFPPFIFQYDVGSPEIKMIRGVPGGGACCFVDPDDPDSLTQCEDTTELDCTSTFDGDFQPGAKCNTSPCAGACCKDDGEGGTFCEDLSRFLCENQLGTFKGIDTACDDDVDPCAPIGACCADDGSCEVTTADECFGFGDYQGDDTECGAFTCPIKGACCEDDGTCTVVPEDECIGEYQGDDTACGAFTCVPTGACCEVDGSCTETTEDGCDGTYQGDGTACGAFTCPVMGACCAVDHSCSISEPDACAGTYKGDGSVCGPFTCPTQPCPGLALLCDQACVTMSKCGHPDSFGTYYRSFISGWHSFGQVSFSGQCVVDPGDDNNPPVFEDQNGTEIWDIESVNIETWIGKDGGSDCQRFVSCQTSGIAAVDSDNPDCINCTTNSCAVTNCPPFDMEASGGFIPDCSLGADIPAIHVKFPNCGSAVVYSNFGGTPQFDLPPEFSVPYSTSELIANAEQALHFTGVFRANCAAFRNLTANEAAVTLCRVRYKITLLHAATFPVKIDWDETGDVGGVSHHSEIIPAGGTETGVHELAEPDTNGTRSVQNIVCAAGA